MLWGERPGSRHIYTTRFLKVAKTLKDSRKYLLLSPLSPVAKFGSFLLWMVAGVFFFCLGANFGDKKKGAGESIKRDF